MTAATQLPYTYEFTPDQLAEIKACNEQHGFAIVKGVLSAGMVEMLKAEVRRLLKGPLEASGGYTYTCLNFIEQSPVFATLLTYEPFMRIASAINNYEPLILNRSAAIYKLPGEGPMVWHTDWGPLEHPYSANEVLNNSGASSLWFYLNGIEPHRGGLAIIPDSHTEDWPGPEGFAFTSQKKSFYKLGSEPLGHTNMDDVPGALPVIADPGDLIIFAERTYHGVYPHRGTEPRLSCAMSFRSPRYNPPQVWPFPESARTFMEQSPKELAPYLEGYLGIDTKWRSRPAE